MKTLQILKSGYFYGNKISEYGLQNGYLDYGTLAKAFDAVLCNDITKLFYSDINGEYNEVEQIHGYIDNSDEIEELNNRMNELMLDDENDEHAAEIDKLQAQIDELENEQDYQPEIYQYFIISDNGKRIIEEFTNDPLFYIPVLDVYVWGVTHWGTAWDYVLTDTKLEYMGE